MVNATPMATLPPEKHPVPNVWEAGWAPGSVWTNAENLAYTGIRPLDSPVRSESHLRGCFQYLFIYLFIYCNHIQTFCILYFFLLLPAKYVTVLCSFLTGRHPTPEDVCLTKACSFKVCKSVHHHTIQINQPTRCNDISSLLLTFIYSSACFGRRYAHYQELNNCSSNLWFCLRSVVIAVLLVVVGPVSGPTTTTHTYTHTHTHTHTYIYIYIYIYMHRVIKKSLCS